MQWLDEVEFELLTTSKQFSVVSSMVFSIFTPPSGGENTFARMLFKASVRNMKHITMRHHRGETK